MSDSAASGSLRLAEALPALSTSAATGAPDDVRIDSQAFRRGDPECFALVLRRFGPLIRSIVAAYAKDPDDQDDLYQEVCIRLLTRRRFYKEIGAMEGWVTTLARGCCRNWYQARKSSVSAAKRYAAQVPPTEESGALLDDPSRLLDYRTFLERLDRAVAELPSSQRRALRLVHIEGHSVDRAARALGTTTATVRSNIRHARRKLRELMRDEGYELS